MRILLGREPVAHHPALYRAGGDAIDGYAVGRVIAGEVTRERHHAALRSSVGGRGVHAPRPPRIGGEVDDPAPATPQDHQLCGCTVYKERHFQVVVDVPIPHVLRHFVDRRARQHTRGVHKDVEPAKGREHLGKHFLPLLVIQEVAADREVFGGVVEGRLQFADCAAFAVNEAVACASRRQGAHDRASYCPGCAGDDDALFLEPRTGVPTHREVSTVWHKRRPHAR